MTQPRNPKQLGFRQFLRDALDNRKAPTFAEAWQQYDTGHLSTLRQNTRRTIASRVKHWIAWHGDVRIDALGPAGHGYRARRQSMRSEKTGKSVSAWAVDMEIQAARSVCWHAIRTGFKGENPLSSVKLSRERSRQRQRTYSDAEVESILAATDWPPLRTLILFCRTGGFRPGEVLQALMSDFDPAAGSLHTPGDRRKNHRAHTAYVSTRAAGEALALGPATRKYLIENPETNRPYAHNWIGTKWHAACDAAGVAGGDRVMHALRHTFSSTLFDRGASLPEVADAMGITLKQVETYAHPLAPIKSVFQKAHRIGPRKGAKKILTAVKKSA